MANRQPLMPLREMSDRSAAAGAPPALRKAAPPARPVAPEMATQRVEMGYLVRDVYIRVATRQRTPGFPDNRLAGDLIAETARKLSIMLKRDISFDDVLKHLRSPDNHS